MYFLSIIFACVALLISGLIGITLSVPLQAPAVMLMGVAAIFAGIKLWHESSCERSGKIRASADIPQQANIKLRYSWLLGLSLIAVLYFIMRATLSPVWDLGVEDLMLILPVGVIYLVAGYALKGKAAIALRQGLALIVILLLLLHIGACLMQLKGGEGYSLARYFNNTVRASPERMTGMYGYYGSFANFAVIAGLLCLSLGIWGRFTYGLRALIFLLGLVGLGLAVWSQSRSAALSLCLALGVFITLLFISLAKRSATWKKRARIVSSLLGIMGFIGIIISGLWVFSERGVKSFAMIFDSAGVRIPFWAMAFEQWGDHPWVGAGSRSFSYECFQYWSPVLSTGERNPEFVHNEYLQLLSDYGITGLLLVLGLFVLHGRIGIRMVERLSKQVGEGGLKKGSNAMALTIGGLSGMTAMAVHICFDFRTHLLANLLLLVCCAVWILPVVKSTVLKFGSRGVKESRTASLVLGLALLVLGLGAVGLGGQQLWAGLPLLKNKMAKEDGAWKPQQVDRNVWIPALEESLARSPQWRRYLRLGTLYRLEAADAKLPGKKEHALMMAEKAYVASIERHNFNPIPRINLASMYMAQGRWAEADAMYASASGRAKAREALFGMHAQWGVLHLAIALSKWQEGEDDEAAVHFARAKELFEQSDGYRTSDWVSYWQGDIFWGQKYTQCLIAYADFLDGKSAFGKSEELFLLAKEIPYWASHQGETRLNFHHARHYYQHGQALWHKRQPEAAYQMMLRAEKCMLEDKRFASEQIDAAWGKQMGKIQEVIRFLKLTGFDHNL